MQVPRALFEERAVEPVREVSGEVVGLQEAPSPPGDHTPWSSQTQRSRHAFLAPGFTRSLR